LLPEANGAADGLRFDGWVPLGLNNMYSGRDGKVKAYLSVNNPASKLVDLVVNIPYGASSESHEENRCLLVLFECR
jgi:hypothetical protein